MTGGRYGLMEIGELHLNFMTDTLLFWIMRTIINDDAQPTTPGEFIREVYLKPFGLTGKQLSKIFVSPSTLNRILNCNSGSALKWLYDYPKP